MINDAVLVAVFSLFAFAIGEGSKEVKSVVVLLSEAPGRSVSLALVKRTVYFQFIYFYIVVMSRIQ